MREEQLLLCHRGFTPWDQESTPYRNVPDLKMAKEIKEAAGLPMILDPSHIGGAVYLVKQLATEYQELPWIDGQLIEVHPKPENARTDAKQQLTWLQLDELLNLKEAA